MWYRVRYYTPDSELGTCRYIDDRVLAEWRADGREVEVETRNRWIEGVVNEMDKGASDGEVLDEIIKLIDNGECYAL